LPLYPGVTVSSKGSAAIAKEFAEALGRLIEYVDVPPEPSALLWTTRSGGSFAQALFHDL
jgi:hypothetical protein